MTEGEPIAQPLEIERKFLVVQLPENLEQFPHTDIIQGYLAVHSDGTEVRLRIKGDKFFQTVKSGSGKIRAEAEKEITQEQFEAFWPHTDGKRVEKTRYEIPYSESTIELDIYHGNLTGLVTAEVEFSSEEEGEAFAVPEWFGQDVTYDSDYKNQTLALEGKPRISINDLNISVGASTALMHAGIDTVNELSQLSEIDLIAMRYMSDRRIEEIKVTLSKYGYSLAEFGEKD